MGSDSLLPSLRRQTGICPAVMRGLLGRASVNPGAHAKLSPGTRMAGESSSPPLAPYTLHKNANWGHSQEK